MPPRKKKIDKKNVKSMFINLNAVIDQVGKDRGIPKQQLIDVVENAMLTAARKKLGYDTELEAHYNEELGEIELFQFKTVVSTETDVEDPELEVSLKEAKKLDPDAQLEDSIGQKIDSAQFGRIAAQTAKQVIIQRMRDAERNIIYEEYKDRVGEIITGIVRRFEKGSMIVDLGRTEAIIYPSEQVPGETYRPNDRIQAYFLKMDKESKGPQLILSRRTPLLIKALFKIEVPEISESIIDIRAVAREVGMRAKIAVYSKEQDVDPVGACVGIKGSRVQSVVQELRGEKIDIVCWDEDPAKFVCNAIAPAEVSKVIIHEEDKHMEIIVPDDQLSLAIGKKGQNVRLAAQLTGWGIDVIGESKYEILVKSSKEALTRLLEVDSAMAGLLFSHSFRTPEIIAQANRDDFVQLPGINSEALGKIYDRAKDIQTHPEKYTELLAELKAQKEAAEAQAAMPPKVSAEQGFMEAQKVQQNVEK